MSATSPDLSSRCVQVGWVTGLEPLSGAVLGLRIVLISKVLGGARPSFEQADDEECEDDRDEEEQYFIPATFVSEEPSHVGEVTAA